MTTTLPPLVGLIGKKRVGKDTFASVLVEEFGFARVAFADPLKEMALTIDPIIYVDHDWKGDSHLHRLGALVEQHGWEATKEYPEARRFLQRLGDGVRCFNRDFWVKEGMRQTDILRRGFGYTALMGMLEVPQHREGSPVVITDVRYPNEADAIREAGGTLVRIVRPGVDDGDTHASETALDGHEVAHTVFNTLDLDALRGRARTVGYWASTDTL